MVSKKSPGIDPLGHSPFSKDKLEGPKKHHDDHGKEDSVPAKGEGKVVPQQAWEMLYDATDASKNMEYVMGADFEPKCPRDRKTTYIKVNETDH